MSKDRSDEAPYEGGSQPVREHPPEAPTAGSVLARNVVLAIAVLVVLAAVLWIVVPLGG